MAPLLMIPPFRFSHVEDSVFRGGYPTLKNLRFMRRLQLNTVVSLVPEKPTQDLRDWCREEGVELRHFAVARYNEAVTVSHALVGSVLSLICDPSNLPLYIHCLDGANVTGLIVLCLRKLQHWEATVNIAQFCRFSQDSVFSEEEREFYDAFKGPVQLPNQLPSWLWGGYHHSHPSIQVEYLAETPAQSTKIKFSTQTIQKQPNVYDKLSFKYDPTRTLLVPPT